MNIIIDGKEVIFTGEDKNIVDLADRVGIGIPAPCYRSNQKNGCCKACVIEIDGKQAYACGTKPEENMNIIVNRADLKAIRKERINKYYENPAQNHGCNCDCNIVPVGKESCC